MQLPFPESIIQECLDAFGASSCAAVKKKLGGTLLRTEPFLVALAAYDSGLCGSLCDCVKQVSDGCRVVVSLVRLGSRITTTITGHPLMRLDLQPSEDDGVFPGVWRVGELANCLETIPPGTSHETLRSLLADLPHPDGVVRRVRIRSCRPCGRPVYFERQRVAI